MWFKRKPKVTFKPVVPINPAPPSVWVLETPRRILGVFDDIDKLATAYKRLDKRLDVNVRKVRLNTYKDY